MDPSGRWEHRRTMPRTKRILDLGDEDQPILSTLVTIRERADYTIEVTSSQQQATAMIEVALILRDLTSEILPWSEVEDVR
jgi:hypothetical protein